MNEAFMPDPRPIYTKLLEERRADLAVRERRHHLLGNLQLAAVLAGLVMVVAALAYRAFSIAWAAVPAAIFVAFLVIHDRLLRKAEFRRRAVRYFERALARLDGQWAGTGESGQSYLDPAHPYAQDLDLFGQGSLFELLCSARTHIGEDTLARWLLEPADPDTVRARQEAVEELRPRVDLREDLAVMAEDARSGVHPAALAAWGEAPALLQSSGRKWLWILTGLGVASGASLFLYLLYEASLVQFPRVTAMLLRDVFVVTALINTFVIYRLRHQVTAVLAAVESASHGLGLLSEVLIRLEREQFRSPLLARLRGSLDADGEPPSKRLARLKRLMDYVESRENVFVRILEVVTLWTPHCAYAIEAWRAQSGPAARRWLAATGEIEALCSLAAHAFEHPADPFPEFSGEFPWLEAHGVGHPLIDDTRLVRNDVHLGGELRLLVVSGSNMSGKSTLLRTLGANVVLAQAGAPVRATRLVLSPLAIGASIRLVDSLQNGISRFYAEILRIRQILDQTAGPLPVLFLVDEFLNGTNSHDRLIGAEALVRGLVERGAMGLFTTHDLALADIAEGLGDRAANVHFEDRIEDGKIHFDYVMRPGVVRKSNAIELMRSVGLEI
jgi:hypothetical protein